MITSVPRPRRRASLLSAILLGGLLGFGSGALSGYGAAALPRLAQWLPSGQEGEAKGRDLTLLVMGMDKTGSGDRMRGNTDTLLLVHLDAEAQRVSVLSIPRDTRMAIPGHRTFKVNAANPWGGPELAVSTVSRFLRVSIDRYLLVDLGAVPELVDALGGIDVTVPKRMAYVDRAGGLSIDLDEGQQHLDGEQIASFLRFRHDGMGDIGRVSRQQDLIREAMPQVLHPLQWVKFPHLWAIVRDHAETNLTTRDVLTVAGWMNHLDPSSDVEVETLPGHSATIGGLSYWVADRRQARRVARRLTQPPQMSVARSRS